MAPLTDRSANRQSRIPMVNPDNSRGRNNENAPPASNLSRLLAPTKSSVARSKSPSPIPLPIAPRVASPTETPRGRLSTVRSNDTLNASISRQLSASRVSASPVMDALKAQKVKSPTLPTRPPVRQGSRPASPSNELTGTQGRAPRAKAGQQTKPLPVDKPLPSQPIATFANSMSPSRDSRGIIDAIERPLMKSPGTPHEEEWPTISPERPTPRNSMTPSMKRQSSSRLPRAAMSPPTTIHVVSPLVAQEPENTPSPHISPIVPNAEKIETNGLTVDSTKEHPPRSSSLRNAEADTADIGLGIMADNSSSESVESLEHRHKPPVTSFSQPRLRITSKLPTDAAPASTPQTPVYTETGNATTASRIPLHSPKKTPSIVEIRSSRTISVADAPRPSTANDVLTFAGRRLGNSADLAALDQGTSTSSKRRASTDRGSPPNKKWSPPRKANLSLKDLPPRIPPPAEPTKLSPIKFFFGDKSPGSDSDASEYSRVKKLSGTLSSSSFAGTTLSIADDADHLILGPSGHQAPSEASQSRTTTPIQPDFNLPSPSNNGFHLSWPADFGLKMLETMGPPSPTVQSSPSVRNESMGFPATVPRIVEEKEPVEKKSTLDIELSLSVTSPDDISIPANKTMRAPIGDLLAAAVNDDKLPGATIIAEDEQTHQHITATLSILEGTPVKQSSTLIQETSESNNQPEKSDAKPSKMERGTPSAPISKPVNKRLSMAKLPKATSSDSDESPIRPSGGRLPSYMLPTPASEARKNSTAPAADVRRNNTVRNLAPSPDSRRASQGGRLTPTPSSGRNTPADRRTPTPDNRRAPQSGRSTPSTDAHRPAQSGRATPASESRNVSSSGRPSVARKPSQKNLPKSNIPSAKEQDNSTVSVNKRTSTASLRAPRSVPVTQAARENTSAPSQPASPVKTRPRAESRSKSVLSNLKGLFAGKRDAPPTPSSSSSRRFSLASRKSVSLEPDVPEVPSLPKQRRKSAVKSILKKDVEDETTSTNETSGERTSSMLPRSRRKSAAKSMASKKDIGAPDDQTTSSSDKASRNRSASSATTPDDEKRQTVALMEMGLTLRQEAYKEDDLVRKERMASFAQVMLDTVTNAVEAERNMYAAMQAAEQAKMSYMMTQQSVQEMSKLVSNSRRLPLFRRKNKTQAPAPATTGV